MSEYNSPEQIQPVRFVEEVRYLPHGGREIRQVPQSPIEQRILGSACRPPCKRVLSTCPTSLSIDDGPGEAIAPEPCRPPSTIQVLRPFADI